MKKKDFTLLLLIITALIMSCSNNEVRSNLNRIKRSGICIPDEIICIYKGNISEAGEDIYHGNKYLIYIDSMECTSCRVTELERYQAVFLLADSTNCFDPLVLVSPPVVNRDSIIQNIVLADRSFPIYLDISNQFYKLNPSIPKDIRYHCVLYNRENHPIVIGDPVYNSRMMPILEKQISLLSRGQ